MSVLNEMAAESPLALVDRAADRFNVARGVPPGGVGNVGSGLFSTSDVGAAIDAIAAGDPIIVIDDDHDCGDLVFAAASATTRLMAFTVRYTSGFVCVALPGEECDRLGLPPMYPCTGEELTYRVAVDVRDNGTGISAAARARTAVALSEEKSSSTDFVRPGHVQPAAARAGGVLERAGHEEAALDLVRLAGRRPAAVFSTLMSERVSGEPAGGPELLEFAGHHGLRAISIGAVADYRRRSEPQVRCVGTETLTTADGDVHVLAFRRLRCDGLHLAFLAGAIHPEIPVYVHTECLSCDVAGLTDCTCGSDLPRQLAAFTASQDGLAVYIRPDDPLGACGLFAEMDRRKRRIVNGAAAEILSELGVTSLRLVNEDHHLVDALRSFGLCVNES